MTRQAVLDGFERFVAATIEQTAQEFSVSRAIGGGGGVLDRLGDSETIHETLVQPELQSYHEQTVEQFTVVLDAVESEASIQDFRTKILEAGAFTDAIRSDLPAKRRGAIHDRLMERHRALGEAVAPVVASEETSFWAATRDALTLAEATALIEEQMAFTEPLVEHRSAFRMTVTFDPAGPLGGLFGGSGVEIEYTTEALRAMQAAAETVTTAVKQEAVTAFDA